jgi:hypothetical protein
MTKSVGAVVTTAPLAGMLLATLRPNCWSALNVLSRPPLATGVGPLVRKALIGSTLVRIALRTCWNVAVGFRLQSKAAVPETRGAAIDVPWK